MNYSIILGVLEKTSAKIANTVSFISSATSYQLEVNVWQNCLTSDYVNLPDSGGNSLEIDIGHVTGMGSESLCCIFAMMCWPCSVTVKKNICHLIDLDSVVSSSVALGNLFNFS